MANSHFTFAVVVYSHKVFLKSPSNSHAKGHKGICCCSYKIGVYAGRAVCSMYRVLDNNEKGSCIRYIGVIRFSICIQVGISVYRGVCSTQAEDTVAVNCWGNSTKCWE